MKHSEVEALLGKVQLVAAPPFLLSHIHAKIAALEADRVPLVWQWTGMAAAVLWLCLNVFLLRETAATHTATPLAETYGLHQNVQLYVDKD